MTGISHVPLADIAFVTSGGTPSKSRADYWNGEIPWISGKTLHDLHIHDSDLRISESGLEAGSALAPVGASLVLVRGMSLLREIRVGLARRPVAFNQDVKALVARPAVLPRFLNLVLRTARPTLLEKVHQAGHGTGVLATDRLMELQVWLPPLDEQDRIAGILGAFDDLIETNLTLADGLDALIQVKVASELATSTTTTHLSAIASFVNGKNFTKGADGTGRPVIRTPEVRSGPGGNTVWSSVDTDDDRVARAGDLLFVWSGTLMVNRWLYSDGLVNQHVFKVKPNQLPAWYVFALIEAQLPWFLGLAKDKATTMGHIQRAHLDEPMTGLSPEVIVSLGQIVQPMWSAGLAFRLEAQELAWQRDELLPLLMSGKVRVRDVQEVVRS